MTTNPGPPPGDLSPGPEPPAALTPFHAVFDHAAVAARRIRDLLPIYHDLLGGSFLDGGDNPRVGYRAIQLQFGDNSRIELMEPLSGSTFLDSFFATRGAGGLHHVTFKVDDIEAAVATARRQGLTLTGLYLDDPYWREVFIHPRAAHGTLVQIAQANGPYPMPAGVTLDVVLAGNGQRGNGEPSP